MECEGSEERSREVGAFGIDHETGGSGQIQNGKDDQKRDQAGGDSCKTKPIESRDVDLPEFAPAAQDGRGDQEAGDHEENLDRVAAGEEKRAAEIVREQSGDANSDVDVIEDDEEDTEAAEEVDIGAAFQICHASM